MNSIDYKNTYDSMFMKIELHSKFFYIEKFSLFWNQIKKRDIKIEELLLPKP